MKLDKLMETAGQRTIRHAVPILILTAVITVLSIFGMTKLGVDSDIANLLPSDNPTAKSFTAIAREFQTTSTLIAVIEGSDRETLIASAEDFAFRIESDPRTASLIRPLRVKIDEQFAEKWGFMLQDTDEIVDSKRIFQSTRLLPLLRETNDLIEEKLSDGSNEEVEGAKGEDDSFEMMSRFSLFAAELNAELKSGKGEKGASLADTWLLGEKYFIDPEGKTLVLIVRPNFDIGNRKLLSTLSEGAHEIAAEIKGVTFSFTGDVENEAAEEKAISSDVFYPSLIAMLLIVILFYFSFSRKRSILFALAALVIGILADLGFAAITVHKLNMITSSFGALLVGLGIDFGIHIVSRYDDEIHSGEKPEKAMGKVFAEVGPPIFIGGLTTAVAFYALLLSRTIAFRQFGLVAGTGILTTLASAFIVLPALLAVFPGSEKLRLLKKKKIVLAFTLPAKIAVFSRIHRVPVIAFVCVLTIIAFLCIPKNSFEYDMRKIGPQNTDAQKTEKVVAERFGISTWQQLASVASLEEARTLQAKFKKAPYVRRVESIADYIPSPEEQNERLISLAGMAEQKNRVGDFAWTAETVREFAEEIQRLEWNMIELADLAAASLGEKSLPVRKRNADIREIFGSETGKAGAEVYQKLLKTLATLPVELSIKRLTEFDTVFAQAMDQKITALASVNRQITLDDLPADLRADLVNAAGNHFLVVIQGTADLAGDDAFIAFADGLTAVDPGATGTLTLGLELSREILGEAKLAMILIASIVFLIVGISFRSLSLTLITGAAFLMAFIWMFGLSPFFGKFNIVSALALPLIIGVGIDYCVHIVSALQVSDSTDDALQKTGKAVTLSMLTTVIGFGSLALVGKFQGIADLGTTLTIGIICCYIVAIVIIPACVAPANSRKEK